MSKSDFFGMLEYTYEKDIDEILSQIMGFYRNYISSGLSEPKLYVPENFYDWLKNNLIHLNSDETLFTYLHYYFSKIEIDVSLNETYFCCVIHISN